MSDEAEHMELTKELVRNAQTGDRQAFERLIKLHFCCEPRGRQDDGVGDRSQPTDGSGTAGQR